MTDNEIIKALECCASGDNGCEKGCPLNYVCTSPIKTMENLIKLALDLITRQQVEIERLKKCPKCAYEYDGEVMEYCVQGPCPNFKTVEQIKVEAYKEFAERLKEKSFQSFGNYGITRDVVEVCDIDNLIKEMTEVNENE